MTRYKIVEDSNKGDLEASVENYLLGGWQLQGGICQMAKPNFSFIGSDGSTDWYCQAMIKPEPTEQP